MLDDMVSGRGTARSRLDDQLVRPLDPADAEAHDRESWGLGAEQLAEAVQTEELDIPTYG